MKKIAENPPVDLVIFGLDGTLVDSRDDIADAINFSLEAIPVPSGQPTFKKLGIKTVLLAGHDLRDTGSAKTNARILDRLCENSFRKIKTGHSRLV